MQLRVPNPQIWDRFIDRGGQRRSQDPRGEFRVWRFLCKASRMSSTLTKSLPVLSIWEALERGGPPLRSRTLLTPSLGSCLGSFRASRRHRTPIVPAPSCTRLAKPVLGKGGGEQARRDSRLPLQGSLPHPRLPPPRPTQYPGACIAQHWSHAGMVL